MALSELRPQPLNLSTSRNSMYSTSSHGLSPGALSASPHTPAFSAASARSSSSNLSLGGAELEDATITARVGTTFAADRASVAGSVSELGGGRHSVGDLQVLAVSTHITELSYNISDIQTRIFEIQELRHKSQSLGDAAPASGVIDKALAALDERLEAVSAGLQSISASIAPILAAHPEANEDDESEYALLSRKHATFVADWEAVQEESEVLREELKEDKWLTVFRTVTDQADGMMSSLEKAVNRCQDFIWQVQKAFPEDSMSPSSSLASAPSNSSMRSDKGSPLSIENFQTLLDSFEAKKKHYMPTTTKVLGIIDKGVQDRVTKNGECLRRHAESTARWKALRERITRTDEQMSIAKAILEGTELAPSESASSTSGAPSKGKGRTGYLTPPSADSSVAGAQGKKAKGTLRSISPFRKMARSFKSSLSGRPPPLPGVTPISSKTGKAPSSEPAGTLRNRKSMLLFGASVPPTPVTPGHKHTQSLTPDSSPSAQRVARAAAEGGSTVKGRPAAGTTGTLNKQPWNSSTKVVDDGRGTLRFARPGSSMGNNAPPIPAMMTGAGASPYKRSASRTSMSGGSSAPFSPGTSTSTRPPSRSQYAVGTYAPGGGTGTRPPSRSQYAVGTYTPGRPPSRATTPAKPPPSTPSRFRARGSPGAAAAMSAEDAEELARMQRAFSPPPARAETPGGTRLPHARPPSRSMIPAPVFHFSGPSRPGSAMGSGSDYFARALSPDSAFGGGRVMPSSFRDGPGADVGRSPGSAAGRSPGGASARSAGGSAASGVRPPSRNMPRTGVLGLDPRPAHVYVPGNARDPLDAEVAAVVNSVAHELLVERVDPPLRNSQLPKDGEEQQAQYAFASALARKVVTCRLTTLARPGSTASKKVMVRVGGGWKDLHIFMLGIKQ